MKSLARNKQTIYYALYQGKAETIDSDGLRTGQYKPTYSEPVAYEINVSAAKGSAMVEMFGIDTMYSKKMTTNDMTCPITETTVLWVDRVPSETFNPNYRVVSVAKSINSITYAIDEIK